MPTGCPEDGIDTLVNEVEAVVLSDNEETSIQFHIGESTPRPTVRRGRRSWKKDARGRGQQVFSEVLRGDDSGRTLGFEASPSYTRRDF